MAYTDEQIQTVCTVASDVMKDFTDVQNCTFPSTAIIAGMKAGKTAEEIASDAYDSIYKLPLHQTGFGLVGMGDSMRNIALYMQGAVLNAIKALSTSAAPTPAKPEPGKLEEEQTKGDK